MNEINNCSGIICIIQSFYFHKVNLNDIILLSSFCTDKSEPRILQGQVWHRAYIGRDDGPRQRSPTENLVTLRRLDNYKTPLPHFMVLSVLCPSKNSNWTVAIKLLSGRRYVAAVNLKDLGMLSHHNCQNVAIAVPDFLNYLSYFLVVGVRFGKPFKNRIALVVAK